MSKKLKYVGISFLILIFVFSLSSYLTVFDSKLHHDVLEEYSNDENYSINHGKVLDFFKGSDMTLIMTDSELSHMEDVRSLIVGIMIFVIVLGFVLTYLLYKNSKHLSSILINHWIPIFVLVGLFMFAALFPNSLFLKFHGLFFPQGNFMFPVDSVLITLYPEQFFHSVFKVILFRSFLVSICLIFVGIFMKNLKLLKVFKEKFKK